MLLQTYEAYNGLPKDTYAECEISHNFEHYRAWPKFLGLKSDTVCMICVLHCKFYSYNKDIYIHIYRSDIYRSDIYSCDIYEFFLQI